MYKCLIFFVFLVFLSGCGVTRSKLRTTQQEEKQTTITDQTVQSISQNTTKQHALHVRCSPENIDCIMFLPLFADLVEKYPKIIGYIHGFGTNINPSLLIRVIDGRSLEQGFPTGCDRTPSWILIDTSGTKIMSSCGAEKSLEELEETIKVL